MKRSELYTARAGLEKVGKYPGEKLRYAYARNMKTLNAAIKNIESLNQPSPEFVAYQRAQMELKLEHAEKDDTGRPRIENGFFIMKNLDAFKVAAEEFDEKHKAVRDAYEVRQREIEKFMDEDADILILPIKEGDLPDTITAEEFAGIGFMLEDF